MPGVPCGSFGPAPGGPPTASGTDGTYLSPTQQAAAGRQARHQGLIELADQTGGLALRDRNDLVEALASILADHAGYYLLGYEPGDATFSSPGERARFREVEVKVKRRGLSVRSRKGFYSVPDEVIARSVPPPAG